MPLLLSPDNVRQLSAYAPVSGELHVAVASLSLGGAEKIVLDWAERIYPRWRVHLIVLRDREQEWPVPKFIRVTRLHRTDMSSRLRFIGETIAESSNPVCLCHLLSVKERMALASGGAFVVPVLHNAKNGWCEGVETLQTAPYVIAVSGSCADDLRNEGWSGAIEIIRHIPRVRAPASAIKEKIRRLWNIPKDAKLIGMLGALKPQKNYCRALEIQKALLQEKEAYLAIVGGPVNADGGRETWNNVVKSVREFGLRNYVAMPGFVPDAAQYLSAFDVLLNTSHFEGLSMATLEALLAGIPVVASKVGGQGEIGHPDLALIPPESDISVWTDALLSALDKKASVPVWADFPSYRLWTLACIARPVEPSEKTLFVTANLSSGGAQRSLVNLTTRLSPRLPFEIMVAGRSSAPDFQEELIRSGVGVERAAVRWDVFDHAEAIADKIVNGNFGTVCFWNVDARVKLLLVKAFAWSALRFVDVSPGDHSFEEMESFAEFQRYVGMSEKEYSDRIDVFVSKYERTDGVDFMGKMVVIRNGVPENPLCKNDYAICGNPKIVVSGRIAPTKFLIEIIEAMKILRKTIPNAELHVYGAAEHYHDEYYSEIMERVGEDLGRSVILYGARFDVQSTLHKYDAYVVLGFHQGCPNALLEALSAGLPVVGNDDGGTKEQIIHEKTGLLIQGTDPKEIAGALERLLKDRSLAERLGRAGRKHVLDIFSMEKMLDSYETLFKRKQKELL